MTTHLNHEIREEREVVRLDPFMKWIHGITSALVVVGMGSGIGLAFNHTKAQSALMIQLEVISTKMSYNAEKIENLSIALNTMTIDLRAQLQLFIAEMRAELKEHERRLDSLEAYKLLTQKEHKLNEN